MCCLTIHDCYFFFCWMCSFSFLYFGGSGLVTWLICMPGIHIVDTWMELVLQVLVCTRATPLMRIICLYDWKNSRIGLKHPVELSQRLPRNLKLLVRSCFAWLHSCSLTTSSFILMPIILVFMQFFKLEHALFFYIHFLLPYCLSFSPSSVVCIFYCTFI